LAQNICTQSNPLNVLSSSYNEACFTHKIDLKTKESEGKASYWFTSPFRLMRLPIMKEFNIEDFNFSNSYFFYWDTIERCLSFLSKVVETSEECIESQLLTQLLDNPLNESKGNWTMFANIVSKHGLIPEQFFPDNLTAQSVARLNDVLKSKLREYAKILRDLVSSKRPNSEIQSKIDEQMSEVYSIASIMIGNVPEKFTWDYADKSGKSCSTSPFEFYETFIEPYFDIDNNVAIVSTAALEYGKLFRANYPGNMIGGERNVFNNQRIETLTDLITKSIVNGEEAVLACCSVNGLRDFQL
jgi:bleomycin hydrolase